MPADLHQTEPSDDAVVPFAVLAHPAPRSRTRRLATAAALFGAGLAAPLAIVPGASARPALDDGGSTVTPAAEEPAELADPGPRELRPTPVPPAEAAPDPVVMEDPGPTELRPEPVRREPQPEPVRPEPEPEPAPTQDPGPTELRPEPAPTEDPGPSGPRNDPPPAADPPASAPAAMRDPGPRELRPGNGSRPAPEPPAVEAEAEPAPAEPAAPLYDPGPRELRPGNGDRPASVPPVSDPPAAEIESDEPAAPLYDPGPRELRPGEGTRPASEPPPTALANPPRHPLPAMEDPGPRELRPGNGTRPEYTPDYPDILSIGDAPSLADDVPDQWLPFPGDESEATSVAPSCGASYSGRAAATCTGLPPSQGPKHRKTPTVDGGVSIESSVTSTSGRSDDYLTADGERTNLTVSLETVTQLGGEASLKHAGIGYEKILNGDRTTYVLTVSPERAEEIAAGTADAPDPHDPRTLGNGEGLLLNQDEFGGSTSNLDVEAISLEDTVQTGQRDSAGVRRIDEDTVRVTVGDDDIVRQAIKLGVSVGDLAGLNVWSSDDLADGEATQVDLDISTPEGWEDYQRFINTGRIPYRDGIEHAEVDRQTYYYNAGASGNIGPVEWTHSAPTQASDVQEIRHGDGSTDWTASFRNDAVTATRTERETAEGYSGETENTILLEDVNGNFFDVLDRTADVDATHADGETVDVRVDLSDSDLLSLRRAAIDTLRDQYAEDSDGYEVSEDEMVEMVRDGTDYVAPSWLLTQQQMTRAETPEEILLALYDAGRGNSDNVALWLNDAGYHHRETGNGTELPGDISALED